MSSAKPPTSFFGVALHRGVPPVLLVVPGKKASSLPQTRGNDNLRGSGLLCCPRHWRNLFFREQRAQLFGGAGLPPKDPNFFCLASPKQKKMQREERKVTTPPPFLFTKKFSMADAQKNQRAVPRKEACAGAWKPSTPRRAKATKAAA